MGRRRTAMLRHVLQQTSGAILPGRKSGDTQTKERFVTVSDLRMICSRVRERIAMLDLGEQGGPALDRDLSETLHDILDGRMPSTQRLRRLAEALDTTVAYLQGDSDEPVALGLGLAERDRLPKPAGRLDSATLPFAPLKDGQVRLVLDEVVDQETFYQIMRLLKENRAGRP